MHKFERDFLVCASNVNSDMHITNKALLGWMEDIGSLHSDVCGCGYININEHHLSWIIMQWEVEVIRRPAYGEKLRNVTWVSGDKRVYAYRQHAFYDEEGKLVVRACGKWVLSNTESGVIKLPRKVMDGYGINPETVFDDNNNMPRITEPEGYESVYDYRVPCTCIDVNGHMNNKFYLDIAYQALPIDVYMSGSFDGFEIMYKRECKLNDDLKCYYHFDGEKHIVTIKSAEDGLLHAIVRLRLEKSNEENL